MILRMQAQTATRFDDVLVHVTFTGAGGRGSPLVLLRPDQSMGPGGFAGESLRVSPKQTDRC